jgi:hypothetical protein
VSKLDTRLERAMRHGTSNSILENPIKIVKSYQVRVYARTSLVLLAHCVSLHAVIKCYRQGFDRYGSTRWNIRPVVVALFRPLIGSVIDVFPVVRSGDWYDQVIRLRNSLVQIASSSLAAAPLIHHSS